MTQKTPLVSIITPSFNKGPYIEETIQSIRIQTYKNIEHIIIDAGSTDETIPILKKYKNDIQWISEPDRGQSDAINKGWRMAKGDIIAYLNADDTYLPDAVESAVRFLLENPGTGMVYGDGIITDELGRNPRTVRSGEFSQKNLVFCQDTIFQPSVFLKREVFLDVGEVDVDLHLAMDLDYWLRTSLRHTIHYLEKPLSVAKIYRDAKSSAMMHRYIGEYEHILRKLYASHDLPLEIISVKSAAYCFIYTKGALDYIHALMLRDGVRYLWKGFCENPAGCVRNIWALLLGFLQKRTDPVV